jgi:hypothetical protein
VLLPAPAKPPIDSNVFVSCHLNGSTVAMTEVQGICHQHCMSIPKAIFRRVHARAFLKKCRHICVYENFVSHAAGRHARAVEKRCAHSHGAAHQAIDHGGCTCNRRLDVERPMSLREIFRAWPGSRMIHSSISRSPQRLRRSQHQRHAAFDEPKARGDARRISRRSVDRDRDLPRIATP